MERTKTFVNGGRVYPADLNAIEDRAAEMLEGTAAAIPSSHFAGRYYRATDTGDLYLDNGTTWKKIAGKEIVADEQVITGRALVETGNTYGALTSRAENTEFEASASRVTFVSLNVELEGGTAEILVENKRYCFVGGAGSTTGGLFQVGFPLNPGKKWKWVTNIAKVLSVKSSYLLQ